MISNQQPLQRAQCIPALPKETSSIIAKIGILRINNAREHGSSSSPFYSTRSIRLLFLHREVDLERLLQSVLSTSTKHTTSFLISIPQSKTEMRTGQSPFIKTR